MGNSIIKDLFGTQPNLFKPIFCFSPKNLILGDIHPRFYTCWAKKGIKRKDPYKFSYIICDEVIEGNEFRPKVAANCEEYKTREELISRLFKFIDQFEPHDRISNDVYLSFSNVAAETLEIEATDYCLDQGETMAEEFIKITGFAPKVEVSPVKIKKPRKKKSLVDNFFKKPESGKPSSL